MARLVYACRFDVATENSIANVLNTYRDWIVGHYRGRRGLPEFNFDPQVTGVADGLPTGHSLISSAYQISAVRAVRCLWSFPDDRDAGLRWANEVRVGQFGDRCGVEHLIFIESVEYSVAPARLVFGSPRAIRDICTKTPAFIGEMQVKAEPYALEQDGLDSLLKLLTSDLRRLPVVLLSSYTGGDLNQIDPVKLARNLAGVAVVVLANSPELTWDFADEVGRQLSCFNGAARIYWPGFTRASDPRGHRLFLGTWIDQVGAEVAARTIERTIFAVAAFRYVPDSRIADVIRRAEAIERQQFLQQKKESGDEYWEDYQNTLDKLREAEERLEGLTAENANLRANQQVFLGNSTGSSDELDQAGKGEDFSISSVAEAVRVASKRYKNVEFLDTAISSAADSPFLRPYDVFEALADLDAIVDVWCTNRDKNGSGGDLLQHLRDRGWGKRSSMHISDTTRGKFRAHYEFEYQGKKQLFEPHITIGSGDPNACASIHFVFDRERAKMIVGHVGKHLPNTKA
jgi:hypothetical protein